MRAFLKSKKFLLSLLAAGLSLSAVLIFFGIADTYAEPIVADLFQTRAMTMEDSASLEDSGYTYNDLGLKFTGRSGAQASYAKEVSGDWEMNFIPSAGIGILAVDFQDAADETKQFTVQMEISSEVKASIIAKGQQFGSYYDGGILKNLTYAMNLSGAYTETEKGEKYETLLFDAENKTISINNVQVWDFSVSSNDGKDIGWNHVGDFQRYTVRIRFVEAAADSSVLLASVNGQSFEYPIFYDRADPQLFMDFTDTAYVGQTYLLPQVYGFDVCDGQIAQSRLNVAVSFGQEPVEIEEGSITIGQAGEYTVTCIAETESGQIKKIYKLQAEEEGAGNFLYDKQLPGRQIGAGTLVTLPEVSYTNALNKANAVFETAVTLYRDGERVADVEAGVPFTAEQGNYVAEYRPISSYYAEDLFSYSFTVSGSGSAFQLSALLNRSYSVGDFVELPSGSFVLNGQETPASVTVTFPDGALYGNHRFEASMPGMYEVCYYAESGAERAEEIYSFRVEVTPGSLVTVNDEIELSYGAYRYNSAYRGLIVDTTSGGELVYNQVIDLSEKTRQDKIFSLIVDPSTYGMSDFMGINVRLTDIYDENNYLDIRIEAQQNLVSNPYANMRIAPPGQTSCGLEGNIIWKGYGGYYVDSSFAAKPAKNLPRGCVPVEFYYDYELMRGYGTQFVYDNLIADLKNRNHFPEQWQGFTTGEVRLSITTDNYVNSSGRYILLSVDGISFAEKSFADIQAPVLTVENAYSVNPVGAVGYKYPIFSAHATDLIDGKTDVATRVFFDWSGDGKRYAEMDVKDGAFYPEYPGRYVIRYYTSDRSGNLATREEVVEVRDNPEEIALSLDGGEEERSVLQGAAVELPQLLIEGGVGDVSYSAVLRSPDGRETDLKENSFRPAMVGDYTVTYTAVDFIGNESRPLTFTVKVTAGGTQFKTEEVFLPEVLLDGVQYTFPEIRAVTYGASGIEREGTAEISVLTPAGEQVLDGRVYMPSAAENLEPVTFRLKFDGKTQEIAIPVAKPMNGDYLLFDRMFYADSADVSVVMDTDLEIRAAAASNSRIWYANRILADFLSISFESLSADMDAFHLWIVDSVNPEEQLCFRIVRSGSGAMVSINGGTPVAFQGSFDPSAQSGFSISYLSESKVFQDASKTGSISVPDESWKGFSSGYVYFCFEFTEEGVPAGSGVRINSVNQQNFIGNEDFNRPMISIEDIIGGIYEIGNTVVTPRIWANDVLGDVHVTMSVRMPSDEYAVGKDGKLLENASPAPTEFEITQSGRYVITYYLEDSAGNTASYPVVFYSTDKADPVISVSGVPDSAKVGSSVRLPEATVSDENTPGEDLTVYIFCISESGSMEQLSENLFRPTKAGIYTIRYVVFDSNYNYDFADFRITVK